jgi:hypothetical protein
MIFDKYTTSIPGWVTSIEAVAEDSIEGDESNIYQFDPLRISLIRPPAFVIGVLSLPNGSRPPWLSGEIELRTAGDEFGTTPVFQNAYEVLEPSSDDGRFLDQQRSLIVLNDPRRTSFQLSLVSTPEFPIAVNFMAFHGTRSRVHPSAIKCWTCKSAAKALALAIVAAATLPALPAALIAAVATWLGATALVAAAFIGSVIGDTADVIAEKLCKKVGLC